MLSLFVLLGILSTNAFVERAIFDFEERVFKKKFL